jgi:hypothetical protein
VVGYFLVKPCLIEALDGRKHLVPQLKRHLSTGHCGYRSAVVSACFVFSAKALPLSLNPCMLQVPRVSAAYQACRRGLPRVSTYHVATTPTLLSSPSTAWPPASWPPRVSALTCVPSTGVPGAPSLTSRCTRALPSTSTSETVSQFEQVGSQTARGLKRLKLTNLTGCCTCKVLA